jgi:hypothetical protein
LLDIQFMILLKRRMAPGQAYTLRIQGDQTQ